MDEEEEEEEEEGGERKKSSVCEWVSGHFPGQVAASPDEVIRNELSVPQTEGQAEEV